MVKRLVGISVFNPSWLSWNTESLHSWIGGGNDYIGVK